MILNKINEGDEDTLTSLRQWYGDDSPALVEEVKQRLTNIIEIIDRWAADPSLIKFDNSGTFSGAVVADDEERKLTLGAPFLAGLLVTKVGQ